MSLLLTGVRERDTVALQDQSLLSSRAKESPSRRELDVRPRRVLEHESISQEIQNYPFVCRLYVVWRVLLWKHCLLRSKANGGHECW